MIDGRRFVGELALIARAAENGRTELLAPRPGYFRAAPQEGALFAPGMVLGELEVLGARFRLIVPAGAQGAVVALPEGRRIARRAVQHGERLVTLDPAAVVGASASAAEQRGAAGAGLAFRAPMSGRYYAKPGPDAEPFVKVGDVIETGRTIALLEVMKTFNRVQYGGASVPERAKIVAIVPKDGDDVNGGDPILALEPA
ncbi:acetyl-CoA carboxylase biotin carboxyl carrier protein [Sandaracinus amylolyticus]|uniref:acetyl-CoA carboxylase biotin carboxyl carrier protein n=1 Tax=Sandaracinus amylolyticus TaxID=927083 RepID=UPI001F1729B7|nr:biotin/lipoyl-containing protein [Sandaracinus amylolyticus]UJR79818.1 Biotin carboxyl carrier protein of acetyl-CoA carboxylase [Sandaracinus amylolyticus]